jgi:hypothetical protein
MTEKPEIKNVSAQPDENGLGDWCKPKGPTDCIPKGGNCKPWKSCGPTSCKPDKHCSPCNPDACDPCPPDQCWPVCHPNTPKK